MKLEHVTVESRKKDGAIQFSPLCVRTHQGLIVAFGIVFDGQERRWFPDFEAADKIARDYNDGPGDDAVLSKWDRDNGEWVVSVYRRTSAGSSGREDFHVDG